MKKVILCLSLLFSHAVWGLSCSNPVTLTEMKEFTFEPKLSINNAGEAVVIWGAYNDEYETVNGSIRGSDKVWSAAAQLSNSEEYVWFLKPHIDEKGKINACWGCDTEETDDIIRIAQKEKNGSWSSPTDVVTGEIWIRENGYFDTQGNLNLGGSGNNGQNRVTQFIRYQPETGKKTVSDLSDFTKDVYGVTFAVNKLGKALAVWEFSKSEWVKNNYVYTRGLKLSWLQDNQQWSPPVDLTTGTDYIGSMGAGLNSKGDAVVVWQESNSETSTKKVRAMVYTKGKWSEVQDLMVSSHYSYDIQAIVDEQGNTLVVWTAEQNKKDVCYAAHKLSGQPWAVPLMFSNPSKDTQFVQAGHDNNGHFFVTWAEIQKERGAVYGATLSTETPEWTHARLSPEGQDCWWPSFDFNEKGEGVIAWSTTWDGYESHIQVADLTCD